MLLIYTHLQYLTSKVTLLIKNVIVEKCPRPRQSIPLNNIHNLTTCNNDRKWVKQVRPEHGQLDV